MPGDTARGSAAESYRLMPQAQFNHIRPWRLSQINWGVCVWRMWSAWRVEPAGLPAPAVIDAPIVLLEKRGLTLINPPPAAGALAPPERGSCSTPGASPAAAAAFHGGPVGAP